MRFIKLIVSGILATVLICSFAGCGSHDMGSHSLVIQNGYVRVPPRAGTVAAGYFTINNGSDKAVELTGVSSPSFGRMEMHETVMADGMMAMNELSSVNIAPGASVEFKPGGNHLMLFEATKAIVDGATYDITFALNVGGEPQQQVVKFSALPFGQSPDKSMDHSSMGH